MLLSVTSRVTWGRGSGLVRGNKEQEYSLVSMLTFMWQTKPAQLTSGDLHLVSERTELGLGRITIHKPAKSYFIAFCSSVNASNCSSALGFFLFPSCAWFYDFLIHYFSPLLGFREGHLGAKPAAPRPPLVLNPTFTLAFLYSTFHLCLSIYPESSGFGMSRGVSV